MAVTFTLTSTGLTTIDLTDTSTSIFLQESEYVPIVATPTGDGSIPPYVTETLPVGLHAMTYDAYCLLMQDLAALQKRAAEYWVDREQATPVWLNCKLDGETTGRRALVKAMHFEFRLKTEALYRECGTTVPPSHLFGTLLIERHPYWEAPTARTFPRALPAAGVVYAYDYTAAGGGGTPAAHDIVGDVGARIEDFQIEITSGDPLARFWLGFRSALKHPTLGNFVPTWELENGTNNAAESGITDDAASDVNGASPGGGSGVYVKVVETDLDWDDGAFHQVMYIELNDVTANEADNFGLFLWLLRAEATDDDVWEVQCSYSGSPSIYAYDQSFGHIVEIDDQDGWLIVETDVMPIPVRNLHNIPLTVRADSHDLTYTITIWARRTTNSGGELHLDALYPIPLDEGYAVLNAGPSCPTGSRFWQTVHVSPEDTIMAEMGTSSLYTIPSISSHGFALPIGDGRMIAAWARNTISNFTDLPEYFSERNADDAGTYYERWTVLRGAE